MLKLRHIYFVAVGLGLAFAANADEPRYVSDNLLTYIHSGQGNQYRIVGTLNSGDAVTLLGQNDDTGFDQVRDEKGRTAWIPRDQLSAQPSLRTWVPALEQQVQDLTQQLDTIDANWNQRTTDMQKKVATSEGVINNLKEQNQALKDQLSTAQKKVNAAAVQLDDKQRTIIMQWFMYGGGVAGVGLLLGLLLPHMIPRRKRDNRWRN
ncbi:SH3 domain-containing protein [Sodalis-like symbiont of Bactericera trigonica]|nr:SH3 domain-containing protein [Sodalis-like symbiont of Bactericera trigonica]